MGQELLSICVGHTPERPNGTKDEAKKPKGPLSWSQGPEGPQTSSLDIF